MLKSFLSKNLPFFFVSWMCCFTCGVANSSSHRSGGDIAVAVFQQMLLDQPAFDYNLRGSSLVTYEISLARRHSELARTLSEAAQQVRGIIVSSENERVCNLFISNFLAEYADILSRSTQIRAFFLNLRPSDLFSWQGLGRLADQSLQQNELIALTSRLSSLDDFIQRGHPCFQRDYFFLEDISSALPGATLTSLDELSGYRHQFMQHRTVSMAAVTVNSRLSQNSRIRNYSINLISEAPVIGNCTGQISMAAWPAGGSRWGARFFTFVRPIAISSNTNRLNFSIDIFDVRYAHGIYSPEYHFFWRAYSGIGISTMRARQNNDIRDAGQIDWSRPLETSVSLSLFCDAGYVYYASH